jgi:hypothetical protein
MRIAIVQSNYIPWKGYFDLIRSVDEFVLFDDVSTPGATGAIAIASRQLWVRSMRGCSHPARQSSSIRRRQVTTSRAIG